MGKEMTCRPTLNRCIWSRPVWSSTQDPYLIWLFIWYSRACNINYCIIFSILAYCATVAINEMRTINLLQWPIYIWQLIAQWSEICKKVQYMGESFYTTIIICKVSYILMTGASQFPNRPVPLIASKAFWLTVWLRIPIRHFVFTVLVKWAQPGIWQF